ncbi:ATP-binding protein [Thioclava atlantica]|uniref:Anti-sigma regulatory factor n=1 Tax=Thioclava atlantica TaxID=1317124 RepID=A0A085TTG5_9RHOB|nr:ATP-binding protein [Thioclava atlantica]KFE34012.1 anti-sigma regulatory factor [Thioclava atlantica]
MPERSFFSSPARMAKSSGEARIFHHSFPATPIAVRDALRAALARFVRVMSEEEAGTLELILAEILNNVVEHSYGEAEEGSITLSIVRDAQGLSCSVSDDGIALPMACLNTGEPESLTRPDPAALPEGGFGWFLIRDLATELGYRREGERNLLAFRLPLAPLEDRKAG